MRSKIPWFWICQFLALTLLGLSSLFFPYSLLQFYRGYLAPQKIERPTEELNSWVLGLEELDPPSDQIREFFADHEEAIDKEMHLWSPDDPALKRYTQKDNSPDWRSPETLNVAWEDVETWILSGRPAPPKEDQAAIKQWIHASDQIPEPSAELRRWIANMRTPQSPPKELRLLILQADQVLPDTWRLAAQQIRFASPCILAAAFFTLLGLVTPSIRRPLARVFVLICMFWGLAQLDSSLGPNEWNMSRGVVLIGLCLGVIMVVRTLNAAPRLGAGFTLFMIISLWWASVVLAAIGAQHGDESHVLARTNLTMLCIIFAFAGITNAWYWLIGKSEDPPQDNAGIVQRRPPQLWTLWVVQFLILFFTGVIALLFPSQLAELFMRAPFDHLTTDVVDDSVKSLGAWIMSMALFSFFALGVGRDWVWQAISVVFCIVFLLLALSTVRIASTGEYSYWVYLYGFQGVVFIPVTIILLQRKDPYSNANVERIRTEDWCLTDLLIAPLLFWSPALRGRRPLYGRGVGAIGFMRVLPPARNEDSELDIVPPNDFFEPDRRLPIKMRFSNCSRDDDASLDIRGCALHIGSGENDRLDLLFATGEFSPFSTLIDFQRFLLTTKLWKLVTNDQTFREGLAAGMRRAPSSFANLSYYHQLVLEWATPNAESYLVRFRIVPRLDPAEANNAGSAAEQGIPNDEDLQALWRQDRRGDETRNADYLRRELSDRLKHQRTISFQLEAQYHKPQPGDTLDWYDATIEWEFRESPWLPLAELVLEASLSENECECLLFDPSRLPFSLNVPRPDRLTDLNDPRALGAARYRLAKVLGGLRVWRNRIIASRAVPETPVSVATTV